MKTWIFLFILVSFPLSAITNSKRPNYKKGTLEIENKKVQIEIARTDQERSYGLMFVKSLEKDSGMLFVFNKETAQSFWMKNTLIPLSIGFFDKNQRLVDVQEMVPEKEQLKTYMSKSPALYALEMNKNWFSKNKIPIGAKFTFVEE